jgi:hypothetical protein
MTLAELKGLAVAAAQTEDGCHPWRVTEDERQFAHGCSAVEYGVEFYDPDPRSAFRERLLADPSPETAAFVAACSPTAVLELIYALEAKGN